MEIKKIISKSKSMSIGESVFTKGWFRMDLCFCFSSPCQSTIKQSNWSSLNFLSHLLILMNKNVIKKQKLKSLGHWDAASTDLIANSSPKKYASAPPHSILLDESKIVNFLWLKCRSSECVCLCVLLCKIFCLHPNSLFYEWMLIYWFQLSI